MCNVVIQWIHTGSYFTVSLFTALHRGEKPNRIRVCCFEKESKEENPSLMKISFHHDYTVNILIVILYTDRCTHYTFST